MTTTEEQLSRMTALAAFFLRRETLKPDWSSWTAAEAVEYVQLMASGRRDDLFSPGDRVLIDSCRKATKCDLPPIIPELPPCPAPPTAS